MAKNPNESAPAGGKKNWAEVIENSEPAQISRLTGSAWRGIIFDVARQSDFGLFLCSPL